MANDIKLDMDSRSPVDAINWSAEHCFRNDALVTGRVQLAMLPLLQTATQVGQRMANWPGLTAEDVLPLRLAGGLHNLHLTGAETRLAPIYSGEITDQAEVDAIIVEVVQEHDARLRPWLDGPPQTNEAGRSASIMAALLWLSERIGPKFELLEIGCSAGANTMMDRFAFDLGGVNVGPRHSPILIKPDWKGPPPPAAPVEISAIKGCDRAPLDLSDAEQATRLTSYCWPENTARLERLKRIIAMAAEKRPDVVQAHAADWVEEQLALPQAEGTTRVLFHSIVWQYIDVPGRARIEAAMAAAGSRATKERPLAWIMLETNRKSFRHEMRVKSWPGSSDWVMLGEAHAHGAWVEWAGLA